MAQIKDYKNIVKADVVFTAIDVETTGLDKFSNKIIELACVKYCDSKEIGVFSTLIDPNQEISPDASKVNGITNDMVSGKPSFESISKDFISFIADTILVAHNIQFDLGFINSALINCGLTVIGNKYIDTLDMSRRAFPGRQSHALQNLAAELEINVTAAHRAEDDSRVCMDLFYKCNKVFNPEGQISLF